MRKKRGRRDMRKNMQRDLIEIDGKDGSTLGSSIGWGDLVHQPVMRQVQITTLF